MIRVLAPEEPKHKSSRGLRIDKEMTMRSIDHDELLEAEAVTLERAKFTNWEIMKDAVRNRAMRVGGLQQIDIPSRSLFLLKSGFPAPKVTAAISLDGQRLELHSAVRERVTGLVDEQSHTF